MSAGLTMTPLVPDTKQDQLGMVTLMVEGGYTAWREQALLALAAAWPPERLCWTEPSLESGGQSRQIGLDYAVVNPPPLAPVSLQEPQAREPLPSVRISRVLNSLLHDAALCRTPERWALLYRVLWRWQQGDRSVESVADEDGARLYEMAKAVRKEKHDMMAYVRFRRCEEGSLPEYWAWFEPEHEVLEWIAEHFAKRMGGTSWCIATPQRVALWDGQKLQFLDAPENVEALRAGPSGDQVEALWLRYYQSIFNPARLNETALQQSMPVRFWKGLPEARLIPAMISEARNGARRVGQFSGVAQMPGKLVAVEASCAQPQRSEPSSLDLCRRCGLWEHATQAVPGEGLATARMMLLGEQPGDYEDLEGRVFVGPAGQILDQALQRAGIERDALYLSNAVKHFKWTGRGKQRLHVSPSFAEVQACGHWLQEELARVKPVVIVTLGATALSALLGPKARLSSYLAKPFQWGGTWLIATWHPSYALRVPDAARREEVLGGITEALQMAQRLLALPDRQRGLDAEGQMLQEELPAASSTDTSPPKHEG